MADQVDVECSLGRYLSGDAIDGVSVKKGWHGSLARDDSSKRWEEWMMRAADLT